MAVFSNAMLGAFVGKVLAAIFLAACVVLGFGPDKWVNFVLGELPGWATPGVARAVFLGLGLITFATLVSPWLFRFFVPVTGKVFWSGAPRYKILAVHELVPDDHEPSGYRHVRQNSREDQWKKLINIKKSFLGFRYEIVRISGPNRLQVVISHNGKDNFKVVEFDEDMRILREIDNNPIRISFSKEDPLFVVFDDDELKRTAIRVRVANRSYSKSLYNVRVVIKDIVARNHAFPNAPLRALGGLAEFDLSPRAEQVVDVLTFRETGFEILLCYADKIPNEILIVEGERHLIRLEAQAKDTRPATLTLQIDIAEDRSIEVTDVTEAEAGNVASGTSQEAAQPVREGASLDRGREGV